MTNRCEDAPCCGCCGTNLYGVNQDSAFEPEYDPDFGLNDGPECDTCEDDAVYAINEFGDEGCPDCGQGADYHFEQDPMEDQWLDGSYEE